MKKILIAILMFCCVPMFARGDGDLDLLQKTVAPFDRIRKTVKSKYPTLLKSDFIFLLYQLEQNSSEIDYFPSDNITLAQLAQACANYTQFNKDVNIKMCEEFMIDVIRGVTTPSTADYPFSVTTTSDTKKFEFMISAAGKFTVDCGNGKAVRTINKMNTKERTITCNYDTTGAHTIKIGGRATAYSTEKDAVGYPIAAISFEGNKNLEKIEGTLGAIFPTLANGSQPVFTKTFYNCEKLTGVIPATLFAGIKGPPAYGMFWGTFTYCKQLNGPIPADLFTGISGNPASRMFRATFYDCKKLDGQIPESLFENISGGRAEEMFYKTFSGCLNLSGTVGPDFFGTINPPIDADYVKNQQIFDDTNVNFQ